MCAIKVTPLSGAQDESPPCYLLQIDDFGILLDCGWDEHFNMDFIETVKKHLHQIDAVLLSYPDPVHLGALPYLVGKVGLDCPIYATFPVYQMGQMFMYDVYQSRENSQEPEIFTLDDVDAAFEKIQHLAYSQSVGLKGQGQGLVINPLPAGHMLGGTIWKIVKDGVEEVVYMVDYNHQKDRHLNGCTLDSINRPHLLITDAYNADYRHIKRSLREEHLVAHITKTMRNDGNVLICTDTAGRVLDLAQLLDQTWRQESGLRAYSLALINNFSYNTVHFAKTQLEWMSDEIVRAFEDSLNNPFKLRHVRLCHNLADLAKVPEPKVVLASGPDLECGCSRDLFIRWCTNPKNTVVLTNRTSPGTLARFLIDNPGKQQISLQVCQHISSKRTFNVQANVIFIDFEGRSDGESMKKIILQIRPQMLVLIRGNAASTEKLAKFCRSNLKDIQRVYTPHVHQVTDATTESHIYQVKLQDSVVSALNFAKAQETELTWIDAVIHNPVKRDHAGNIVTDNQVPVLKAKPESQSKRRTAVYINEPKLLHFKRVLQNKGIQVKFTGGALICNNNVTVRRNEAGGLVLEGCPSDDYNVVRDLLYAQYAIV